MKAAKALKEKGETPEELLRSIKENEAAVAEAQRVVDAWKAIVGEKSRREEAAKAEAERIAAEKAEEEARVEAERKAEEERKTKEEERKERDENGQPFVVSSDGTTTFGEITEDTGLTAAPIKLSEGVADEKGNGYGLRHIEARHGDQIRKAGFSSVEEFVKYVASNYDKHNIKIGKKRANGVETYLIQAEDEHSNMLYVELSKDGSYWNVNSGGIFRKGYAEKKKDVGQNTEHPTSATTLQDKSFVQTDKDNGSQSADTHSDKQHPSADKGTTLAADQQSSDKENTKKVADSEGENTLKAKIEAASAEVNTDPTEAQKEAGNYKKGHVQVGTFDISIEQPEGSIRRGTDADGKKWESKMHNTYGYFRGTEGVDGDHIDVFLSNDIDGWNGRKVFVVDQYNPDGTFDEHKVMLGFNDMDEAKSDYLANYEKGWENGRRITVSATNLEDFEKWIDSSHRKTKPFSEYSSVNKETVATDKGGEKPEKKQEKQSVFDKAKEIADKEEKKRKAEAEDDSVLGQATRAVGKKKKVNLFKYTASKIISDPALRGVHYANGYAYASDGYILFKEKADYPKEWEGTTRDKDGNLIDGKYPDAEKAIHRLVHIPDKEVESLPSKEVLDFAIAASKKLKVESIPVAIDGIFFNAVNLKKFLEAVASKGMDKVVYRHPMLYATNGKDEIVLMPTVNTLEGALDIADRMESAGLPKEQIDAWKAHIEAADKKMSFEDFKKAVENAKKEGVRPTEPKKKSIDHSVRENRSEKRELTAAERELRDNLVERMRKGGLDVVTDSEEMQRVIDTENERTRNKRSKKSEAARKRDEALYAVDWSTAFVSGKSREEATEIRRERGRKFKEETKELYGRVLSGNFDDVTLRLIDKFVDNSTPNNPYERPISKRLPARALQKMRGRERTGSIDALFSRISESAVGKDGKALPRAERERAIEEKKKELLKKWAIATGNWHTDIADFTDQREPIGSGTDSDVYLGKDGKSVIKVSKGKPYGKRFRPDVDNVALFNTVFPGSRYTIEGYGEIDGKFVRFLKQPIVDFTSSTPLTEGERVAYMEKLGFKPINKENTAFSNGEIIASDLQKSNIVKDKQGNVRVIDADMKLHTKDFGGKFSYPDAETDTRTAGGEVYTGSVREHRVYHGSGADFDAFDHSHMGEGEGAQAYGWGTYVTEVEGIGRTYAIQNTTKHNDALRALQHDVDAISDQLNRQRDDLKYDEEQLKRANEWRAEAELDYELFKNEAEELKEKYGESSPKYRNHLFNDIYTDEMKRAQSSVKSTEESIQYRKEKIAELEKALKDKQAEIDELPKEFPRHLYTVEIPDDNGSNYLDWNGHPAESLLKDVGSFLESEGFERVQDNPGRYEKGESTVVLNPKATGADLYAELREALGSDKKASQALAELGCIGIKYPADNMRGGREDGAKNYVIFNENDAKITDHTRFLRTAGGEVYGLVKDGRIYLDPKVATAETAVHEYTHLWGDMLRRKDSEQWSHTVKELKNSVLWEEVKELYPELKTDDEIADEVLSTFSGRRGAERLREEARRVADGEGGVFTKAKAIETLERVKEAIARFWEDVARMFDINRYRSTEELADMAMRDLINGVKPTSRTFTFDNFYKDTKAVFEGTERPKGKPDYTSYSGSEYWYGEDKGGKYVVRGSDHWSGEFKVNDGERTNVGRNHYSEITEDGMLPIGAQGSLKFGWEKGLSKPVGSGISAAIDRRGSGDSNNIASCYWYIDNAKEKDNKGFTYGKAYLSEFEDKERRRDIPGDDWRDIQGLEGGTRAMAVKKANDRFNEELELQVKGELEEGHVYKLGMPSEILLSTGVPNLPIELSAKQLSKKAADRGHRFDVKDIANLPQAIQAPIAVFEYGNKDKSQNLIVEIERDGKKFVVGIHFNQNRRGIVVNDIRGLFNKDSHEWLNWISQGKLLYADKEKIQALMDKQRTNLAEVNYLNLDDVAKKVKDFENPKLFDGKISEVDKKGSDSIDRSVRENPKNEDKPRFSRKPGESIFDYASRVSEDVDRSVRERVSARYEYEKKVKSKGFQTKEALQNSMLGLQEFMYAIDHASGNKRYIEDIPDFENPILGENRLSSVNKEESHSRLDAAHSPTPTKGVRKPYLRSYTMIYCLLPTYSFLECIRLLTVLWRSGYSIWRLSFKQMKQNFSSEIFLWRESQRHKNPNLGDADCESYADGDAEGIETTMELLCTDYYGQDNTDVLRRFLQSVQQPRKGMEYHSFQGFRCTS